MTDQELAMKHDDVGCPDQVGLFAAGHASRQCARGIECDWCWTNAIKSRADDFRRMLKYGYPAEPPGMPF